MGAGSAAAAAATRPDLVRAVVLEDPAIPWRDADETAEAARARVRSTRLFIDDLDSAAAAERADGHAWAKLELEPWAKAKQQVDARLLATGLACLSTPWQEAWGRIAVPTLLVTGTGDVVFHRRHLSEVATLGNADIEVALVPEADHCVRRDNPRGFHAIVDPWVASRFT